MSDTPTPRTDDTELAAKLLEESTEKEDYHFFGDNIREAVLTIKAAGTDNAEKDKEIERLQEQLHACAQASKDMHAAIKERDESRERAQMWHDRRKASEIERDTARQQLADAKDVLMGLASYLSVGGGDDNTTMSQYDERIREGIKLLTGPMVEAMHRLHGLSVVFGVESSDWGAQIDGIASKRLAMSQQLAAAHEALKRKDAALKSAEWAAVRVTGGNHVPACPICYQGTPSAKGELNNVTEEYADEKTGHTKDCKLAAALATPAKEEQK